MPLEPFQKNLLGNHASKNGRDWAVERTQKPTDLTSVEIGAARISA